ncbi:MAG: hypothetical protein F4X25_09870 [Chloroflexi bacterium]|nr:hypothetical protein [Chloroflexota bacterium]
MPEADIRIVALPEGEDPDSMARNNPDDLRALIDAARPVADHLFDVIEGNTDLEDPRSRSQAAEAFAPIVEAMKDPVERSHWLQRLARLGRIDESEALKLVEKAKGPVRPTPVPSSRELAAATRQPAPSGAQPAGTVSGESEILWFLIHFPSCREAGEALEPGTFEDGAHARLFAAWHTGENLGDRVAESDDEVQGLYALLLGMEMPEAYAQMTDAVRNQFVSETAKELPRRRSKARMRFTGIDWAEQSAKARREEDAPVLANARAMVIGDTPQADTSPEHLELSTGLVDMDGRHRVFASAGAGNGEHIEQPETHSDSNGGLEAPDGAE